MKIFGTIVRAVLLAGLAGLAGCGSGATTTTFPHQLVAADGRPIVLDDIKAIINDTALSEDEKRVKLRDLGIEDEQLIDALLTL